MSAKLKSKENDESEYTIYRKERRSIIDLLSRGEIELDDAKRLAGESIFLYMNRVPTGDPQFRDYQNRKVEAWAKKILDGTGVSVSMVGSSGVMISTPNGRMYYDGRGHLRKVDSKIDYR